ncbi:MAG: ferrous iron transport protein B [Opitutaceae bacterium]|jgi:ferrous iron transport protein B|nr:ferrous iron transport protein B [Opitutaceae bacterium]
MRAPCDQLRETTLSGLPRRPAGNTAPADAAKHAAQKKGPTPPHVVAIAGNPNCGKSTLFNALTGLRQKTGNYPGVTVERKTGRFHAAHGEPCELVDLPGAYSLQARSADEAVTRDILLGRQPGVPRPNLILCVLDASNLERNLYLAAQLAELSIPLVIALNMADVAEAAGQRLDPARLSALLNAPVVPTVASRNGGIVQLRHAIARQIARPSVPNRAPLPDALETAARGLAAHLAAAQHIPPGAAFAEALLLVSSASPDAAGELPPELLRRAADARRQVAAAGFAPLSAAIQARYAWIRQIASATIRERAADSLTFSDKLDAWLTHKLWGWIAFAAVMALMFFSIFRFAEIPMGWIEALCGQAAALVSEHVPEGDWRSLLVDGVIPGVGGVVAFLPQIMLLFLFIGLLEDTGYMARAVFIIDRVMARAGLNGKSFVPMLGSFACAIPGIMAARTIDNQKDRLVTILVAPLMSCSARIPVYTLMIAVLLPSGGAWQKSLVMLAMYLTGMAAAFGLAWLFRKTLFRGERSLLLLEMPPYRRPLLKVTLHQVWARSSMFLRRAGTLILAISVVIWALTTYPKPPRDTPPSDALAASYAGQLGRAIEPAIKPLGYDWKIGVGLLSSFAAREAFVGTMGIIHSVENAGDDTDALRDRMSREKRPDGSPAYTPLVCVGLMVFYVLAMQCLATLVVVRRETGGWRWPLLQFACMTALAWLAAFVIHQAGRLLGLA